MKTAWHSWLVGILALIWNAGGAYDDLMFKTANAARMRRAGVPG